MQFSLLLGNCKSVIGFGTELYNNSLFGIQVATVQGLSGTGSLRLAAALIERYFPDSKVLISSPTWGIS